ncbi:MAG TPA: MFS transporter [Ilumatobacter sp.]|nr:MFS transporter [Ilumatobacter sp.]
MTDAAATPPPSSTSAWAPLRNRVFFALFIGQLASNLGSMMQTVGAAWLLGDLGASSAIVAMVQTATFLPVFLVGIPAGALADLFDRRKLLVATQAFMMVTAFTMALLTFLDAISPIGVLGLTAALGVGTALMAPAWMAIQPDLVGKEQFGQAIALSSMTFNVGRAIGPAIGGLIIAASGPEWVFGINAISFVGTLLVLVRWRPKAAETIPTPVETFTGAAVAGLRYGVNSRLVRTVLVRVVLLMLPGAAVNALLPIVVRGPLNWSSSGYGILLGCFGVGATVSAALRPQIIRKLHPDALMSVSAVAMAGNLLVQGFVPNRLAVGVALFAGGFMWSLATTATTVAAQAAMPDWVRARGMALYALALTGSIAIGAAVAGLIANASLELAHLIPAAFFLISPFAMFKWPLTWPQQFDLTPIAGDSPVVALEPRPDDGPVLVTVAYRVTPDELDEFGSIMQYVRPHRRRTGAFRWGLYRDLDDPDRFLETFVVSSWAEHVRQHHRRTATSDTQLRRLKPFMETDTVAVTHYISASSPGGMDRPVLEDGRMTLPEFEPDPKPGSRRRRLRSADPPSRRS